MVLARCRAACFGPGIAHDGTQDETQAALLGRQENQPVAIRAEALVWS